MEHLGFDYSTRKSGDVVISRNGVTRHDDPRQGRREVPDRRRARRPATSDGARHGQLQREGAGGRAALPKRSRGTALASGGAFFGETREGANPANHACRARRTPRGIQKSPCDANGCHGFRTVTSPAARTLVSVRRTVRSRGTARRDGCATQRSGELGTVVKRVGAGQGAEIRGTGEAVVAPRNDHKTEKFAPACGARRVRIVPMSERDVAGIVRDGYDQIADEYLAAMASPLVASSRSQWTRLLLERLAPASTVLDLGCGPGVPTAAAFASAGHHVVGVDISPRQIELARTNVPDGEFVVGDVTEFDAEPGSFDAVMALYSLTHIPRDKYPTLFGRVATWLRPGGWFLASMGTSDDAGWNEENFLGFGHSNWTNGCDPDTSRRLLRTPPASSSSTPRSPPRTRRSAPSAGSGCSADAASRDRPARLASTTCAAHSRPSSRPVGSSSPTARPAPTTSRWVSSRASRRSSGRRAPGEIDFLESCGTRRQ